jgi:ubiquinol-cytochrome c reductase iron-sulfur subunit
MARQTGLAAQAQPKNAGLNCPDIKDQLRDPNSDEMASQQPKYAQNAYRSVKPEVLVLVGICTHLGCSPTYRPDVAPADLGPNWKGGFFCPCHGSSFDLAGRVYKNVPAPLEPGGALLPVSERSRVLIGVDPEAA